MLSKKSRKLSEAKAKLDDSDLRQGLDYSHVLLAAYFEMMKKCRVVKHPKVKEALNVALDAMADVYQAIGAIDG